MFVQHDVFIAGIVVEVRVEFYACRTLKRVALPEFLVKPIAQLNDAALFRGEVEIVGFVEGVQHIQIIAQSPVVGIGAALGGQIGRVYQEANSFFSFPLLENIPIVFVRYGQSVKVMVGKVVGSLTVL